MKPKNLMTPGDLWVRVAVGAVLIVVGFAFQAEWLSMALILIGAAWIALAVVRAVRQVKAAERLQAERNARR